MEIIIFYIHFYGDGNGINSFHLVYLLLDIGNKDDDDDSDDGEEEEST